MDNFIDAWSSALTDIGQLILMLPTWGVVLVAAILIGTVVAVLRQKPED